MPLLEASPGAAAAEASDEAAAVALADAAAATPNPVAGRGGTCHTFLAVCRRSGAASKPSRAARPGPAERRAHSQAASAPTTTPNSTPHTVPQLEADGGIGGPAAAGSEAAAALPGTGAEGCAAPGATEAACGALVAESMAAEAAARWAAPLVSGATVAPGRAGAAAGGAVLPAGPCARAAGAPPSNPSNRQSRNGWPPTRGQPAGRGRRAKAPPLAERLRVMKHLG